jgi:outer membrane receptor protein involved in Fe transport
MHASVTAMVMALGASGAAYADAAAAAKPGDDNLMLDQVVVTASSGTQTKMHSSLSVTSVGAEQIQALSPQSQAEVLRLIPGIIAGDTAGPGGNANFSVRGLPVTTGGSPFVQLQEDGLPVVLFGDMNFGNNDYWQRLNPGDRVESVRGGSASTFASQAPGAVINYISDTGTKSGGQVGLTSGLGFNQNKLEFVAGGPISDTLRYHVAGYYIHGEGPRKLSWNAQDGYQIKANITKDLADDRGYVRLSFKRLDDKEPTYQSSPASVSTSGNGISSISSLPGVNPGDYTFLSNLNKTFSIVNPSGQLQQVTNEGIHPEATSFGAELHYKIDSHLTFDDKIRRTNMSGVFATSFGGLSTASSIIGSTVNGGTVGSIRYANGANAGQAYTGAYVNTGPNIYVKMRDMGSLVNDMTLTGKYESFNNSTLSVRGGVFYMDQTISQVWAINPNYAAVGGSNPAQLNLFTGANGTGQALTVMGAAGYGNNWGNCCARAYDLDVVDTAPYVDLSWDRDALHLNASVREDTVKVTGYAEGGITVPGGTTVGGVNLPTMIPNSAVQETENYSINYTSWSLGALYDVNSNLSVFARASNGKRANVDRNILSGYVDGAGKLNKAGSTAATDPVQQSEIGFKSRGDLFGGRFGLNVTAFHAAISVHNFDLTIGPNGTYFSLAYHANGLEWESNWQHGPFQVNANFTYVDTNIVADSDPLALGKSAKKVPTLTYMVAPSYDFGKLQVGMVVQGQTTQYNDDDNTLELPAQTFVDAFAKYSITPALQIKLSANNLFDSYGISNSDQGSVSAIKALGAAGGYNGVANVSPYQGRVFTLGLNYVW